MVWEEPCPMCAMALVHSRVGRLFFREDGDGGILDLHINWHGRLNHRYLAFRM
jgi:tRNA-specific adenosine deaminase 3